MNTLLGCGVTLLVTAALTMQGQVMCAPPVIPSAQKLDTKSVDQPPGTADLPSVIASVKAAMQCYQDNRGDGADALPKLMSAAFDFKTATGLVGGLSFSIFIFKFGASDHAFQHLRPNNLVMWEAIKRYAADGFKSLHLGRTSQANDGLRRYKLGFGARGERIEHCRYDFRKRAFTADGCIFRRVNQPAKTP